MDRQRKVVANASDKSARRNAPLVKAQANRALRRKDRAALGPGTEAGADAARLDHRVKPAHWGTENAAARRARRDEERRVLDVTAGQGPRGRRRYQEHILRTGDGADRTE